MLEGATARTAGIVAQIGVEIAEDAEDVPEAVVVAVVDAADVMAAAVVVDVTAAEGVPVAAVAAGTRIEPLPGFDIVLANQVPDSNEKGCDLCRSPFSLWPPSQPPDSFESNLQASTNIEKSFLGGSRKCSRTPRLFETLLGLFNEESVLHPKEVHVIGRKSLLIFHICPRAQTPVNRADATRGTRIPVLAAFPWQSACSILSKSRTGFWRIL
jgi:hypothetical protein